MSNASFTEGTFVTDTGGYGRPRVEVVKLIGSNLVKIAYKSGKTSVVPAERLVLSRTSRTPYKAGQC
jgi:hypothetical protein